MLQRQVLWKASKMQQTDKKSVSLDNMRVIEIFRGLSQKTDNIRITFMMARKCRSYGDGPILGLHNWINKEQNKT